MAAPWDTLPEKVNLWRGKAFSGGFGLWDQLICADLRKTVPRLNIPVYLFKGKYDYAVSATLAGDYIRRGEVGLEEVMAAPLASVLARALGGRGQG